MKYILSFLGIALVVVSIFVFREDKTKANEEYMRVHITANSNSNEDTNIKYLVKDAVVEFLIPKLAEAENKLEAQTIIMSNLNKIEEVANSALKSQGVDYLAKVSVGQEDMPARMYENLILEEGVYDSLQISLGEAKGDNWWCVVFPAVCFIDTKNYENVEYISKIWEIINNVTQN